MYFIAPLKNAAHKKFGFSSSELHFNFTLSKNIYFHRKKHE
jgi:hypothetical protein